MYMCLCVRIPACLQRPEKGIEASGAGVTGSCELPSIDRCLKLNPDPLEEQQVLLTPESSLERHLLQYLLIYLIASDCKRQVTMAMPYLFLLTLMPCTWCFACLQMPLWILRNESNIVALSDFQID